MWDTGYGLRLNRTRQLCGIPVTPSLRKQRHVIKLSKSSLVYIASSRPSRDARTQVSKQKTEPNYFLLALTHHYHHKTMWAGSGPRREINFKSLQLKILPFHCILQEVPTRVCAHMRAQFPIPLSFLGPVGVCLAEVTMPTSLL